jgi:ABC-2 type transport system ATP-binding protein
MNSIEIKNIKKFFYVKKPYSWRSIFKSGFQRGEKFVALDDISFTVSEGEMIGIIGSNGSGKTTLLRTIGGIYDPDFGKITIRGKLAPLLQIGTGFHEELIAKENIMMYGMLLGLNKDSILDKIEKILDFTELKGFENKTLFCWNES